MKKSERVCIITQILTEHPNKDYSLGGFAEFFGCAKSSISEDIKLVRGAIEKTGYGYIETTFGARGGVRYVPYISDEKAVSILKEFSERLEEPGREVGGGFLYTADLMFDPRLSRGAARIFARHFAAADADVVVTLATKGIGIAIFTAHMLNLPLVVIRHETRVSDGSAVSVNFFSGSSGHIQRMSLSRRALKPGARAIIIDDYIKDGGSMKGIEDILSEFLCKAIGIGVLIAEAGAWLETSRGCYPLLFTDAGGGRKVTINTAL